MATPTFNFKTIEKGLVDGVIRSGIILGEMWLLKQTGLMKKNDGAKAIGLFSTVVVGELLFNFAEKKKWLPEV